VLKQNEYALSDMLLYSEDDIKNVEELDKKSLDLAQKNSIFPK